MKARNRCGEDGEWSEPIVYKYQKPFFIKQVLGVAEDGQPDTQTEVDDGPVTDSNFDEDGNELDIDGNIVPEDDDEEDDDPNSVQVDQFDDSGSDFD